MESDAVDYNYARHPRKPAPGFHRRSVRHGTSFAVLASSAFRNNNNIINTSHNHFEVIPTSASNLRILSRGH
jgi:hypothetical protein